MTWYIWSIISCNNLLWGDKKKKEIKICTNPVLGYKCCCAKISLKTCKCEFWVNNRSEESLANTHFLEHDYSPLLFPCSIPLRYASYNCRVPYSMLTVWGKHIRVNAHIHVYGLSIRKPTFHFNKPCSGSAIQGHLQGSDSIIPPFTTGGKHFHGEWFCLNRLPSQIIQFPLIWLISYQGEKEILI